MISYIKESWQSDSNAVGNSIELGIWRGYIKQAPDTLRHGLIGHKNLGNLTVSNIILYFCGTLVNELSLSRVVNQDSHRKSIKE